MTTDHISQVLHVSDVRSIWLHVKRTGGHVICQKLFVTHTDKLANQLHKSHSHLLLSHVVA